MRIALDPNHAWAHSLLGQALHYSGRSQDAIEPLQTAIRLDPNEQDSFLHHLALAYFGVGWYEDAAAALNRRLLAHRVDSLRSVLHPESRGKADMRWTLRTSAIAE
jgi:adenylate cyclase